MERSVIFLQSLLMLILAKHVISSTSHCICEFPADFCKENITAVQGKVLGSQQADKQGDLASEESMAFKTRFRINMTQVLIKYQMHTSKGPKRSCFWTPTVVNGSHELQLNNNTFKIPVPLTHPCHNQTEVGKSYIFIGNVKGNGKWSKLRCELGINSRSRREESGDESGEELGEGLTGHFNLLSETITFGTLCEEKN